MLHKIQDFVLDDRDRWIALLECGHLIDVPDNAPAPAPEWSRTEHGRKNLIGSLLDCEECARAPRTNGRATRSRPSSSTRAPAEPASIVDGARTEPVWIDDGVAFGRLRSVGDLERIARAGFRSVVCLDQAGEPGQSLAPLVAASWARALAMTPSWIPIDPGRVRGIEAEQFVETLRTAARPIFVGTTHAGRGAAFAALWLGASTGCTDVQARGRTASHGLPIDPSCNPTLRRLLDQVRGARSGEGAPLDSCCSLFPRPHLSG